MKHNKLIADFMGAEWHKEFFKEVCIISPSNIHYKFHESWDWLMPVVRECFENGAEGNEIGDITHGLLDCDIDATYKGIVQFIKSLKKY
tara:strand:+ start:296 stop:562 length:267 start_codon:yes stop_codon:yes gene_type:complete